MQYAKLTIYTPQIEVNFLKLSLNEYALYKEHLLNPQTCESCQNGRHNEPLPVLPGNELNQSSPKLKTMVVKTINCHHFICLFYQACAISA